MSRRPLGALEWLITGDVRPRRTLFSGLSSGGERNFADTLRMENAVLVSCRQRRRRADLGQLALAGPATRPREEPWSDRQVPVWISPFSTWADPVEMADVITFLVSPRARYISGEIVHVDGGMRRHAF